ncbi:MAG: hypothetical protein GYB50_25315 [Rhodobacteraceae bacterium]|nr:hypothetical protein [Paracoccaceae bacterium]
MVAVIFLAGLAGLLFAGLPGLIIGALLGIPIYYGIMGSAMIGGYTHGRIKHRHVYSHDKRKERILNKR